MAGCVGVMAVCVGVMAVWCGGSDGCVCGSDAVW